MKSLAPLLLLLSATALPAEPIRPLAQDHVVVGESPDPETIPLRNPRIVRLDSGRLVAAYTVSGKFNPKVKTTTRVVVSDDGGLVWRERHRSGMDHGRVFTAGTSVYLLGAFRQAQMGFHLTYDPETALYWLLGSQSTDSMTRAEERPGDRYSLPNIATFS